MAQAPTVNVHSAASLSLIIAESLPKHVSPQLKTPFDAIAIAAHASMIAVSFRLVGLGEDHQIEAHSDNASLRLLPAEWNQSSGNYAFRYAHDQSSMQFLLKVSRMGNKAVIMGMGLGDDKTCTAEAKTSEYVSEGNLPATPSSDSISTEDAQKTVTDVFISAGRLSDLGSLMRVAIIQKLVPSLQKTGYEETQESTSSRSTAPGRVPDQPRHDPLREERDPPARPHPFNDPLAHPRQPGRPLPEPIPGFEDEFEALRPPRGGIPGGPRIGIGERDLYPQGLGPNDPLRGGIGPGFGPMGGGGGMHPTFDDPLFAGQGRRGGGYDPQNPPGSRYDPVGPGMGGHPRGAGMGGRPPNPFGGFGDGDFI